MENKIFKVIKEASERNLGLDYITDFSNDLNDTNFLIEEEEENLFRLFTKDFVIEAECEVILDDEDKDCGTWKKEYTISEVTGSYYNKPNKGIRYIEKYIKNNIMSFV